MFFHYFLFCTVLAPFLISCGHKKSHTGHEANAHMHKQTHADLIVRFSDSKRDVWQKPHQVLELLGDLKGKKIIDIGSGSGYFAKFFQMAQASIVAADVDDIFLGHIQTQLKTIETRKIHHHDPLMKNAEFDIAFTCNTYHHIDQRVDYFKKVFLGLKANGVLMIVDFRYPQEDEKHPGPPSRLRIPTIQIETELKAAGFKKLTVNKTLLPFQDIVIAFKSQ
jgi:cyclopropane fatty-acyl-phospholipid synthase-like methyltransferase